MDVRLPKKRSFKKSFETSWLQRLLDFLSNLKKLILVITAYIFNTCSRAAVDLTNGIY